MPTFTPPVDLDQSRVEASTKGVERALFRHIDAGFGRARNVYKLTSGAYVEETPDDYDTVDVWYYGGRTYTITDAEAAALTSAGYDVE